MKRHDTPNTNNSPRRVILDTRKKPITLHAGLLLPAVVLLGLVISLASLSTINDSDANATEVPFSLTVSNIPVLQITIGGSDVNTSVSPASVNMSVVPGTTSATFVTTDLDVTVGTSSNKGYTLNMYASNTDLTYDGNVIPTLGSGSYYCTAALSASNSSDCTFTTNRWGYRLSTDAANTYKAVTNSAHATTIASSNEAVNSETTNLTFGARVASTQTVGTYTTTLNFVATANTEYYYMQDFTSSQCSALAKKSDFTLYDKRDGNTYTVRYFAGHSVNAHCWMTQNLNLAGGTEIESTNSNVADGYTYTLPTTDLSTGNSYTDGRVHSGTDSNGNDTMWYNYCAASAGHICSNSDTATSIYDICPKGWTRATLSQYGEILSESVYFKPVTGGYWSDGELKGTANGWYSSATSYSDTSYWALSYNGSLLTTSSAGTRQNGLYLRCLLKEESGSTLYMQDVTNSQLESMMPIDGYTAILYDKRDEEAYTIARINGNYWMTQNLRFFWTSADTLTPDLTNVASNTTLYVGDLTSGNSYTDARIHYGDATYGTYYNYCAASVGTVCQSSTVQDASHDICPAGWRLPTLTEFQGITSQKTTFSPVSSGYYYSGTLQRAGSYGYWWSATAYNAASQYYLYYSGSSLSTSLNDKRYGYSVRCIRTS